MARIALRLRDLDSAESTATRRAAAAAAAREAHRLQGAAQTVGLAELAGLAERLHDALADGGADGAEEEPNDLARALKTTLAEIEDAGAGPTVLHVEDNPLNAVLVERVLARRPGIRLVTATHGETALELARERQPELILLDLNLPDMSGVEVLIRLRAEPATSRIPVVVVTAHEPARTSARLRELAIREYLPKPIVVSRLLELVDELAPVTR